MRACFRAPAAALFAGLLLLAACGNVTKPPEIAYVAAPQVNLRDRVAAVYNKTGTVKNGERVEVLAKGRRFVKVKDDAGETGWVEQRYLVGSDVYEGFQALARDAAAAPVQAVATTRSSLNMHLTPGRDTDHLFQLAQGEKVELLKRSTAAKSDSRLASLALQGPAKPGDPPPAPPLEDWFLVRDSQRRVGWVLARMIDLDTPLEIAQYAEGDRIVGFFVLNQVQDEEQNKQVAQYLVLLTEPRDGMPFDYNQIRIFTWNTKRHRYETAYRERNIPGIFPVTVGKEDFGKDGVLPVFTLREKDDQGQVSARKYRLIGPIVRRVLAPGEPSLPKPRRRPAGGKTEAGRSARL